MAGSAIAVTGTGVLPVYLVGLLSVQLREDMSFGTALLGTLVALFFGCSAIAAALASGVVRRAGTPAVMRGAALISAACLLAMGTLASGPMALGVALVIAGVCNGVGQPASNAAIARAVPPGRQGLAYGAKQAAIPMSTLLGGLAVPLIALPFGWRWAFVAAGLGGLVAAATVPGATLETQPGQQPGPQRSPAAGPFRRGPLMVLAAGIMLAAAAGNAMGAFFVASAVAAGVPPAQAGLIAAVGSAGGMVTRIVLGAAADRYEGRWLLVVALLMGVGALGYALLASDSAVLLTAGVLIGYCTGWAWAGLATYSIARMHPDDTARATGITQAGLGLGSAVGPLAFGAGAAATSYGMAWSATALVSLTAGATVVYGRSLLLRDRPALVESHRVRRAG